MLVLNRKPGESLWIGDARVTVYYGNRSGTIKVAIDAPADIAVLREELKEQDRGEARIQKAG